MSTTVNFNGSSYSVPTTAGESGYATTLSSYLQALASGAATTSTVKQNIRTAIATPVTVVAATDYTVVTNLTVPGAVAVNLPAGVAKQVFVIVDGKGDAGTNNITVDGNGAETINGSLTWVINENFGGIMLQYTGTGWVIIATFLGTNASFTNVTVTGTATVGTLTATSATVGGVAVTTASNTQTLTGKSIDADTNTITNIENADIKAGAAIDATKIADGTVTSTEFQYINTLSSNAQTQIDNKQALDADLTAIAALSSSGMIARTGAGTAAARTLTGTANKITITNGDGVAGNPTFDVGSSVVQVGGNTTGATMRIGSNDSFDTVLEANNSDRLTARVAAAANADIKFHGTAGVELPPGTTAQRPSSPVTGTIRYNTDNTEFEGYANSAWQAVGGGLNEQPVKNYLKSYAQAVVAPGTLSTLASTTSNLVSLTAFYADATSGSSALTSSSSTTLRGSTNYLTATGTSEATGARFVQFPAFSLDGTDLGKPVSISFDVNNVTADGNWDAVIVRYNSSGTHQEIISVAGNASSGTTPVSAKLPTGTTTFNGFFIPGATAGDLYALRLRSLANTVQIRVDTLFVGPQPVRVGAAVTDWQSFTPTYSTGAPGTNTTIANWRRVGDSMEIQFNLNQTAAGTAGSGSYNITIPGGYLADATKIDTSGISSLGNAYIYNSSGPAEYTGFSRLISTSQFQIILQLTATTVGVWGSSNAALSNTSVSARTTLRIPIANWSSNITMADRSVEEYASNSGTATAADDTTSFAYGANGSLIPAFTAAAKRYVRFTTPIQATDILITELDLDGTGRWQPVGSRQFSTGRQVDLLQAFNTVSYGVSQPYAVNSTDAEIFFGTYRSSRDATSFGGVGSAWSTVTGSARFRVRKVSGGAQVGYPIASSNIVGRVDGNAPASGYIGEVVTSTAAIQNFPANNVYADLATVALTAGTWAISFTSQVQNNSATSTQFLMGIGTVTGNDATGLSLGSTAATFVGSYSGSIQLPISVPSFVVNLASSQTYRLKMLAGYSAGTPQVGGRITAIRIA